MIEKKRWLQGIFQSWAILLVLIPAALLRVYKLGFVNLEGHTEALINMTYDLVYRGIYPAHYLMINNFGHYGPLLIYIFAPVMALTKNPYSIFLFTIILQLAASYLLYRLIGDFFGRRGALLAVILYSFSFFSLTHSRLPSPESLLPFFVLLFLYSLFAIKLKGGAFYYVTLFASCAAFLQIHITAFPLALLLPVPFIARPNRRWAPLLVGAALFVASFWPYINYEVKHDFPETRERIGVITGKSDLTHKLKSSLGEEPEPILDFEYLQKFFSLEENPILFTQKYLLCPPFEENEGPSSLLKKMLALNSWVMRVLAKGVLAIFTAGLILLLLLAGLWISRLRPAHPGDLFKLGVILASFFLSLLLILFIPYHSYTHLNVIYLLTVVIMGISFDYGQRLAKGRGRRILGIVATVLTLGYAVTNGIAFFHAVDLGSEQNCIFIKSDESVPLKGKMEIGKTLVENFHGYLNENIREFRDIPVYSERRSCLSGMPIIFSYYLDQETDGRKKTLDGQRPIFIIVESSRQPYPHPRALFSKSIGGYEIIGAVPMIEREGWRYHNQKEPGWQEPDFDDSSWDEADLPVYICVGSTHSGECRTFVDYAPFFWRGWMYIEEPGSTSLLFPGVYGFHLSKLHINGRSIEGFSRSRAGEIKPQVVDISGELVPGKNRIAVKYDLDEVIHPAETTGFRWDLFDLSSQRTLVRNPG